MPENKSIEEIVTDFRIVADRLMEQAKAEKSIKATAAAIETATRAYRFAIELVNVNSEKTSRSLLNEFLADLRDGQGRVQVYKDYIEFCAVNDSESLPKLEFFRFLEAAGFNFKKIGGEFKIKLPRNGMRMPEDVPPKLLFD